MPTLERTHGLHGFLLLGPLTIATAAIRRGPHAAGVALTNYGLWCIVAINGTGRANVEQTLLTLELEAAGMAMDKLELTQPEQMVSRNSTVVSQLNCWQNGNRQLPAGVSQLDLGTEAYIDSLPQIVGYLPIAVSEPADDPIQYELAERATMLANVGYARASNTVHASSIASMVNTILQQQRAA